MCIGDMTDSCWGVRVRLGLGLSTCYDDLELTFRTQALVEDCKGAPVVLDSDGGSMTTGNLAISTSSNEIVFKRQDTGATLFTASYSLGASTTQGYVSGNVSLKPGDASERIFGLGQGDWNQGSSGCGTPRDKQAQTSPTLTYPYPLSNHPTYLQCSFSLNAPIPLSTLLIARTLSLY